MSGLRLGGSRAMVVRKSAVIPPPPPTFGSSIIARGLTEFDRFDYSQTCPGPGADEQSVPGKSPWTTVGADPNMTKTTDATDPVSPPSTWDVFRPAGVYDTGIEGSGGSSSFGHVGRSFTPFLTEIGVALMLFLSPAYHFHSVSEKLVFLQQLGQSFILQITHNSSFLRSSDENIGQGYEPQDDSPIPRGSWMEIELYVKQGNPGIVEVRLDKALRTLYTDLPVLTASDITDYSQNSTAGGGGMTLTASDYRRYGETRLFKR